MAQFYYTIAALPYLSYDNPPSLDTEAFLERCREDLGSADYRRLLSAKLDISDQDEEDAPRFLRDWHRFERCLRNELVKIRAGEQGRDASAYIRGGESITGLDDILRETLNQATPLMKEDVLNRARWNKLDEMEVGHYFDLSRLMIIYLKMQLLERKAMFQQEAGIERFEEIYGDVREAITAASSAANGVS